MKWIEKISLSHYCYVGLCCGVFKSSTLDSILPICVKAPCNVVISVYMKWIEKISLSHYCYVGLCCGVFKSSTLDSILPICVKAPCNVVS